MAEPNPQPDQEEAPPQPVKVKGGGVMGPIVAAIIIVCLLYTSPRPRDS